ncbi:MAG: hypothetical protein Q9187_002404 [Circinaria calcarea]
MTPLTNLNFLSPDSRCYSFDHRANGYARGEGFGVVIIKLLSDALKDGDTIRAVIRATGVNQDGRTAGLTQPSQTAQENLIRETYVAGGLDLKTTRFFEAHGTGTSLGDPCEAGAISAVFTRERSLDDPLYIGAVKSNIGHLEGTSGIAGLLKAILVLEKGVIPPNIWFERPNPKIPVDAWNIKFPVERTAWPIDGLRRASVNSFGYGGSNAHAVLDDAYHYLKLRKLNGRHCTVQRPPCPEDTLSLNLGTSDPCSLSEYDSHKTKGTEEATGRSQPRLLIWSTSDEAGLKRLIDVYHEHTLKIPLSHENTYLDRLAYTLSSKRNTFPWKSFAVINSLSHLQENLGGFVFSGQGAAWRGMGRELLAFSSFRRSLQNAEKYLKKLGSRISIIDELQEDSHLSNVNRPSISQSLCTALQMALVDLLKHWGIYPIAVIGHSSGEIAAAYCAGGISQESAWKISYYRGILSEKLALSSQERGGMISIALSEQDIQPYLEIFSTHAGDQRLFVGCVNSPTNVTITGKEEYVDALKVSMDREKVFSAKLKVDVAYHSIYMQSIAAEYAASIQDIASGCILASRSESTTMFSSVSCDEVSADELCRAEYWVRNLISPVRFSNALMKMCSQPLQKGFQNVQIDHLLEVGPHSTLRRPVSDVLKQIRLSKSIQYSSVLIRGVSALQTSMEMAGDLYCRGYKVDVNRVNNLSGKMTDIQMLVDLPEYPFNHSQTYWLESRLSSNFRFRKYPRHELLGTAAIDWNQLEARWRNFIKVSESPWVKDHKVNDSQLYPASGMLVMAIEAQRQLVDPKRIVRGYRIKDTTFHKALIIPSTDLGVETNFYLRSRRGENNKSSEWSEFRLCSYQNEEWVENCYGVVGVDYAEAEIEVDNGREATEELIASKRVFETCSSLCRRAVSTNQLYEVLENSSYSFGPTFQTLHDISCNDENEATALVKLSEWTTKVPKCQVQEHLIHPTALDGVLQITGVALTKGARELIPPTLPTRIQDFWISSSISSRRSVNDCVKISTTSKFHGFNQVESTIMALDNITDEPRIIIKGFQLTALANLDVMSSSQDKRRHLCYNIDWKPELDLLDNQQISEYCMAGTNGSTLNDDKILEDLEFTCFLFIAKTLAEISPERMMTAKPHLQRYHQWMKRQIERFSLGELPHDQLQWNELMGNEDFQKDLFHRVEHSNPEGRLIVAVGRSLTAILHGEVDALALLFNGNLAENFYRHMSDQDPNYQRLTVYLDLLTHKDPNLKILEIGAGTGGSTAPVLRSLTYREGKPVAPKYSEYSFTDISPAFFEKAQERFQEYSDRMTFKTLDIEKDPLEQGYKAGGYDVIVAANVLHATANLSVTLENTRKLLKPGGKLVLIESCNPAVVRAGFAFGLLPGWWLSIEHNRQWGPLLTEEDWHETLSNAGYSGADISLRDYKDPCNHLGSLIISTALRPTNPPLDLPKIKIIAADSSPLQRSIASQLEHKLRLLNVSTCDVMDPRDLALTDYQQAFCIFLPELEEPYLLNLNEDEYSNLQRMIASAMGILWTTPKDSNARMKPEFGLVHGLSRCVSSEISHFKFVTVALENVLRTSEVVDAVLKIIAATIKPRQDHIEREYCEQGGLLQISRLVQANYLDQKIFSSTAPPHPELQEFGRESTRSLKLIVGCPGLLDTLRFVDDPEFKQPLAANEVEVKVKASGVNFIDVMIALGQVASDYLGGECAGTITRVGKEVNHKFQPGDRVCCFGHGTYKTHVRTKAENVVKIPDDLPFSAAASFQTIYCTAYHALFNIARIRSGESILIHCGAGGVGQAAIQLSKLLHAEIYTTVGTEEKKKLVMQLYDIPEDHIFSSRNESFAQGIKRMTKNRGVDVVLNSLAGEGLRNSWECVGNFGRFIEIGKRDIYSHKTLPMFPFSRNVIFASLDLALIARDNISLLGKLMRTVMGLFENKKITTPHPLHVYPSSQFLEAFRYLQGGKNTGKTVIEMHDDDVVPASWTTISCVEPDTASTYTFDQHATYVIAGGLGGLGRSIARWMVRRGAKNLILLSRSGSKSEAAIELVNEMKDEGIVIAAPSCDVSNPNSLSLVLDSCAKYMPPIKGCVQGSMVLKDGIFENLSLDDFKTVLAPKVHGSWNLHTQLPQDMDFFILLSSMAGVTGNRGQANYACGNTYQDALAHYRASFGQKAVSLDLGRIHSIGYVAENEETTAASVATAGYMKMREPELHAILDYYCDPNLPIQSASKSQVVTGIDTPASLKSKGYGEPFWMHTPLFRNLAYMDSRKSDTPEDDQDNSVDFKALFRSAGSPEALEETVYQALIYRLSKFLSLPLEDIDANKPLHSFGIDSLVAVEIRYWFATEVKAEITVVDILESGSVVALSALAAGKSRYRSGIVS